MAAKAIQPGARLGFKRIFAQNKCIMIDAKWQDYTITEPAVMIDKSIVN